MVAPAETGELAEAFIADALARQGVGRNQLAIHADRGTSMKFLGAILAGSPLSLPGAALARRAAEDASAKATELEAFDQALTRVLAGRPEATGGARGSWVLRKIAEVTAEGYSPGRDLGVLINISPLRDAGVLHPATLRVK